MINKKLKVGNVPNLRFPSFFGEWEVKKLGEVATNKSEKYNPVNKTQFIKCIEMEHLATDTGQLLGYTNGSTSGSIKNVFNKGDVLFGKLRPYLKKYLQAPFDGVCSSEIWVLKGKNISNDFLYRIVQTKSFIDLANQSSGSKMPRADWNIVESGFFCIPILPEQKKIASFLSLIDERISTQNKIINDLKTLKAATAKKIFSQELRFKDDNGNVFSEWEEISLGDALDYEQPTNYLVSSTEYDDSFETPVVTAGKTFILGYTDEKNGVFEKEKLPVIIFDDFTTASQFVDFPFKAKSSAMKILKAKNETNIRFIFEALQMINYEVGGHGRHWISVFSNLNISVPSLPEQNKIANFLSSIDSKIDIETQLLQKLEEQKKYLLQQMFV